MQNSHNSQGHCQGQTTYNSLNVTEFLPSLRDSQPFLGKNLGTFQPQSSVFLHAAGREQGLTKEEATALPFQGHRAI